MTFGITSYALRTAAGTSAFEYYATVKGIDVYNKDTKDKIMKKYIEELENASPVLAGSDNVRAIFVIKNWKQQLTHDKISSIPLAYTTYPENKAELFFDGRDFYEAAITHELTHAWAWYKMDKIDKTREYDMFVKLIENEADGMRYGDSEYAKTNTSEFLASSAEEYFFNRDSMKKRMPETYAWFEQYFGEDAVAQATDDAA